MPTYDPTKCKTSFKGQSLTMFGKDSLIKATRNEDGWIYTPSSTGSGARTRNANKSGTVEITLLAASPSVAILQGFATDDENDGTGAGILQCEDITTDQGLIHATNAWIRKHPDWERQKELGEVVFLFETDELELVSDGTSQP